MDVTEEQRELLSRLKQYIWWQTPENSLAWTARLLAQVMDIGVWEDECAIEEAFGKAVFSCVACGYTTNADINAARNILAAGLAVTGRRGTSHALVHSDPMKRQLLEESVA